MKKTRAFLHPFALAALLAASFAALAGCASGDEGSLSDEDKIKMASSGRDAQMGAQKGGTPPPAAGAEGK